MNILVCISAVPDTTTKITFTDGNTKFNTDGVQFIINPYDEMALTRALEIKEANGAGAVTVIHVGEAASDPVIRKALAIGADSAIRVNTVALDGMSVAKEIAAQVNEGNYDLIFTGRESIDYNSGLVGSALAEHLQVPLINIASKVDVANGKVTAVRDIDGGKETIECSTPCVVTAQKDLAEPRIPNMRGIMQARTKPLNVVDASSNESGTSVTSFELPAAKTGVKLIDPDNAGELIDLLRNEQKLI
jgi:electron transfer flavoprotein beta subunit